MTNSKKVLIVDDDRYIRVLLEETLSGLTDAGVQIFCAKDGTEALQIAAVEKPDLVILDIMMPRIDGYEVCRRIREDLGLTGIHVMMLTAHGQSADRLRGLQVGADEYLTKPFDPSHLVKRASEILGVGL